MDDLDEFGIDWKKVKKCKNSECNRYVLEDCFDLSQDPDLAGEGVKVCARVIAGKSGSNNRIVFKKGKKEASVTCVHTAVCDLPLAEVVEMMEESKMVEFAKSLEGNSRAVDLSPEEHFKALRSYVAGIADIGIGNMFRSSYAVGEVGAVDLPFGFNAMMQKQVMMSIGTLSENGSAAMRLRMFSDMYEENKDWFKLRFKMLDKMLDFTGMVCKYKDEDLIVQVLEVGSTIAADRIMETCPEMMVSSPHLLKKANVYEIVPYILLKNEFPYEVLESIREEFTPELQKKVAKTANWDVAERLSDLSYLSPEAAKILVERYPDTLAGKIIRDMKDSSVEILKKGLKLVDEDDDDYLDIIRSIGSLPPKKMKAFNISDITEILGRRIAKDSPFFPDYDDNVETLIEILEKGKVSRYTINELLDLNDKSVNMAIARSHYTSDDIAREIIESGKYDEKVLISLIGNPRVSTEMKNKIAELGGVEGSKAIRIIEGKKHTKGLFPRGEKVPIYREKRGGTRSMLPQMTLEYWMGHNKREDDYDEE